MASPATAKPLGFGACDTVTDPKTGAKCGARILWKVDKNGRVMADCVGQYDTKTCGANHRNFNLAVSQNYITYFEEMKAKENGKPAGDAGDATSENGQDGAGSEPDTSGERDPEPEARTESGYVFDQ